MANRIDLKNCVLFLKSSIAAPAAPEAEPADKIWMALKFGEGNFTWTMNSAVEYVLDRGAIDDVRLGDQAPCDISFEGVYSEILRSDSPASPVLDGPITIAEICKGINYADEPVGDIGHGQSILYGFREPWLAFAGVEDPVLTSCPPYGFAVELHNNPKLLCGPDAAIMGEAIMFRYVRADSVAVDTRAGQISVTAKANVLQPMVRRPIFNYALLKDAKPIPDGVDGANEWAADPRYLWA